MTAPPLDVSSFANRQLDLADVRAYLEAPVTEDERAGVLALVEWFVRRYPTPIERLAYMKRAHARWRRAAAHAPSSSSGMRSHETHRARRPSAADL
jgi:hypothetical protein